MRSKIFLITGFLLAFGSASMAEKRPPGTMTDGTFEVPAHGVYMSGGVSEDPGTGARISHVWGETVAGDFSRPGAANLPPGEPCRITAGYTVFELFSDRLPVSNLILTVDGGLPGLLVTNQSDIQLGISFEDDLSGLKSARVREDFAGTDIALNLNFGNFIDYTLGNDDGEYKFYFSFEDNAGNVTAPEIEASVILDTVPPETGKVVINNDEKFTSEYDVDLLLTSPADPGDFPTGVNAVRVSTDMGAVKNWSVFSFPSVTEAIIPWTLDTSTISGLRHVFAQFRDAAGNWSVVAASDTITYGTFSPGGQVGFQLVDDEVVQGPVYVETNRTLVTLILSWEEDSREEVKEIIVRRSGVSDKIFPANPIGSPPTQLEEYRIAQENADDGLITFQVFFKDFQGNESIPVNAEIYFNRNRPAEPVVTEIIPSSSSLTFHVEARGEVEDIRYIQFIPTAISSAAGADFAIVPWVQGQSTITYVDAGLVPNTPYEYTITAHEELEHSFPADAPAGGIYTLAEAPKFVSSPVGVEISVIQVSWGRGDNPPGTEYLMEWDLDSGFDCVQCNTSWIQETSHLVENLQRGTSYYFRVRAGNDKGIETEWTSLGIGVTQDYIQPLPPVNFYAESVSSTTIFWKWVRVPSTEDGFVIQSATEGVVATIPLIPLVTGYSYMETGLTPNTTYFRKIASFNGFNGDTTSLSTPAELIVTLPAPPTVPGRPITVVGNEMTVAWGANFNPADTAYFAQISANLEFTDLPDIPVEDSGWISDTTSLFRGLKPATTYYFRVYAKHRASDYRALTYLGAARTNTYGFNQDLELSNILEGWSLQIPPMAFEEDYGVQMEGDPYLFQTASIEAMKKATEKARQESNGYRFPIPGGLIEVSVSDVHGEPMSRSMKKSGKLVFHYPDSHPHDLVVDDFSTVASVRAAPIPSPEINYPSDYEKQVRTNTLRMWILDNHTFSWVKLPANSIDLNLEAVESGTNVLGVFAVMGAAMLEVGEVISYPVPFRPNGPNAGTGIGQTGSDTDGIRFTNLPQEGTIRIFGLKGNMIKEIFLTGNLIEAWDTRATDGEKAASGTYYWITEAGPNRKTGKLMIIR